MSVHLVGGGRDLGLAPAVYGPFHAECLARARARGRAVPSVAVVAVGATDALTGAVDWFGDALGRCGPIRVVPVTAEESRAPVLREAWPSVEWCAGLDGLLVGGGLAPAYHRALLPFAPVLRRAVATGLPYAGFSAGAMIAPGPALVGGWRTGETAVTHLDNGEDLDEVTVVAGLGLVDVTVDVHAAQWGTLTRLVAAVGTGPAKRGVAIDENTVVIVDPGTDNPATARVAGAGQAWLVERDRGRTRIERRTAGPT